MVGRNDTHAAGTNATGGIPGLPAIPTDIGSLVATLGGDGGIGTKCRPGAGSLDCINTYKVDAQVWASLISSAVLGFICIAAFCWLQTFISVYRGRLVSRRCGSSNPGAASSVSSLAGRRGGCVANSFTAHIAGSSQAAE